MDNFLKFKNQFAIPEGTIYLNGNSLGPPLKSTGDVIKTFVEEEWGKELIKAWNTKGWFAQAKSIGNQISKIVGAPRDTIIVGDTLCIQVFQALSCAIKINSQRKYILTDNGNFPADLYIAQGLLKLFSGKYQIKVVEPEEVLNSINDEVAVVMLTEVDYRTGRIHDMKKITQKAHEFDVLTVWDLAHSAGALPVNLHDAKADFAVGCTYKYLNGGPGSPAFIYVAPKYLETIEPALFGWQGHKSPFDFDLDFVPSNTIDKMRVGTPSIIAFSSLKNALDIWNEVDLKELREQTIKLSELFIFEIDKLSSDLELASPRDPHLRGSQVSYKLDSGYEFMQSLIEHKLIGDFRAPNLMRFGFNALFLDESDVLQAVKIINRVFNHKLWKKYNNISRATVT
tara:strand:- start:141 stop:1334 length:1194 start_codon:yes stop_codon:yes gene_type:complete